jgi:hypothetical protein
VSIEGVRNKALFVVVVAVSGAVQAEGHEPEARFVLEPRLTCSQPSEWQAVDRSRHANCLGLDLGVILWSKTSIRIGRNSKAEGLRITEDLGVRYSHDAFTHTEFRFNWRNLENRNGEFLFISFRMKRNLL